MICGYTEISAGGQTVGVGQGTDRRLSRPGQGRDSTHGGRFWSTSKFPKPDMAAWLGSRSAIATCGSASSSDHHVLCFVVRYGAPQWPAFHPEAS
jgi:hypothetical protein